ncbi:hypothetical protein BJV77DRAFT_1066205 [Russula vinacea]|nr:hypothetical protein BJV77DRAFT_1066205 [Russula vinacea]
MSTPVFDYYKILGLTKDASSDDVRRAYKQKVLETHPDKLPPDSTEEEKDAAHEQFSKVHEAQRFWEILSGVGNTTSTIGNFLNQYQIRL